MSAVPPTIDTDRECLAAWKSQRNASNVRPILERYLPLVYCSALRRTGSSEAAADAARAVFLVFARRARKLRKRTVIAGWLFRTTAIVSRKLVQRRRKWFRRERSCQFPPGTELWTQVAPDFDALLDRLPSRRLHAVLLLTLLKCPWDSAAAILRTKEPRANKRAATALRAIAKRLRRHGLAVEDRALELACKTQACAAAMPETLAVEIFAAIQESGGKRPFDMLARRTLTTLAWRRWRRRLAIGIPSVSVVLATVIGTAWYIDSLTGHSRLISAALVWSVRTEGKRVPGLAQPARPWPTNTATEQLDASRLRSPRELYQTTNIWLAHLSFSRDQWKALEPERIGALPNFLQPDGSALLRHPKAQRSGVAGVLGFDFNWTHADFHLGGLAFTNVAARIKGNGTYLGSLYGDKRSFKVDLNRFSPKQKLGEIDELNFNNLIVDRSCMSDALAYEFFRDAGVPAPRTAYAWLTVSVTGQWERKPLGLYVMVEPVDEDFVAERFGSKKTPVFKPVTYRLFEYLGDDWKDYSAIYDLKTKATQAQERRVIDFARLVSHASDAEFAARLPDFLDLDEFARFLAGEVLLSSYDSLLANGQNFYVYLDPRSGKFGFIPWDLDLAWGAFFLLGTTAERERASIWHPWVGQNRFLERVMSVEIFRNLYRAHLDDFSQRLFVAERLYPRIDELAAILREPIAAESDFRLNKFEQAVGTKPVAASPNSNWHGSDRPVVPIKRFIEQRSLSVRRQLDGTSKGIILKR